MISIDGRLYRTVVFAIATWACLVSSPANQKAFAASHIAIGGPENDSITISADGSTLPEVMRELAKIMKFKIVGQVPKSPTRNAGVLRGSLPRILSRLLRHTNYVIIYDAGRIRRIIINSPYKLAVKSFKLTKMQIPKANPKPLTKAELNWLRKAYVKLTARSVQYQRLSQQKRSKPEVAKQYAAYAATFAAQATATRRQLEQKLRKSTLPVQPPIPGL